MPLDMSAPLRNLCTQARKVRAGGSTCQPSKLSTHQEALAMLCPRARGAAVGETAQQWTGCRLRDTGGARNMVQWGPRLLHLLPSLHSREPSALTGGEYEPMCHSKLFCCIKSTCSPAPPPHLARDCCRGPRALACVQVMGALRAGMVATCAQRAKWDGGPHSNAPVLIRLGGLIPPSQLNTSAPTTQPGVQKRKISLLLTPAFVGGIIRAASPPSPALVLIPTHAPAHIELLRRAVPCTGRVFGSIDTLPRARCRTSRSRRAAS